MSSFSLDTNPAIRRQQLPDVVIFAQDSFFREAKDLLREGWFSTVIGRDPVTNHLIFRDTTSESWWQKRTCTILSKPELRGRLRYDLQAMFDTATRERNYIAPSITSRRVSTRSYFGQASFV